jgi:hypothetical protein
VFLGEFTNGIPLNSSQDFENAPFGELVGILECHVDLSALDLASYDMIIASRSFMPYKACEVSKLQTFVRSGGRVMVLLSGKMDEVAISSVNFFLESYGISANRDYVIQTTFQESGRHPREALISMTGESPLFSEPKHILYVDGCSLNSDPPSIPVASTASQCYPFERPITVFANQGDGRVCVVGSCEMFSSRYIGEEGNKAFLERITNQLLEPRGTPLPKSVPTRDYRFISNLRSMSEGPFCCWRDILGSIPRDTSDLFCRKLYEGALGCLPELEKAYELLGIERKPLSGTIKPPFYMEPIPLIPAKPLPYLSEILQPPPIPLIDIDGLLEPVSVKLNRLAHKHEAADDACSFLREAAVILDLPETENIKEILKLIVNRTLV